MLAAAGKAPDQTGLMALKVDAKQRFDALVGGPAGMNMFQVRRRPVPVTHDVRVSTPYQAYLTSLQVVVGVFGVAGVPTCSPRMH